MAAAEFKVIKDEKNIRYTQALKLLGKINDAGTTLTGLSWDIIEALLSMPLSYNKLRNQAKLGKKKHQINYPEWTNIILDRYQEHPKK